jgi:PilZ domain
LLWIGAKKMAEARRSKRAKTFLGAQILFKNRSSVIDCVVKNISSTGAKLAIPHTPLGLPDEFELYVPKTGCFYRVRLIRRDRQGIGVEFKNSDSPASPRPDAL